MRKTDELRADLALRIAPVVLANITTRYPYHDAHLFQAGDVPVDPTSAHPAFGNSFDWHSSVHSHWTVVQLLAHFAARDEARPVADRLQEAVVRNLSASNLTTELAYLTARPTYERPYGWAWVLRLAAEAQASPLHVMQALCVPLRHLAQRLAAASVQWLEVLPAPIRHGVHGNTAFALGLMLDASRALGLRELEGAIGARAHAWFADDRSYPQAWERSGNDFLSAGLAEADLMRRMLPEEEFRVWWRAFLPGVGASATMFAIVDVPNVSDGQIAHLHGLNLSRAGMLARIAAALRKADSQRTANTIGAAELLDLAEGLYRAGVTAAVGGDYLSTHWLATFAWDAASSVDTARSKV